MKKQKFHQMNNMSFSFLKRLCLFSLVQIWTVVLVHAQATGGTVSLSGTRRIHKFTTATSLTYSLSTDSLKNVNFTVVGGGGQGGGSKTGSGSGDGAGGGGGGVYNVSSPPITTWIGSSFVVNQIGAGGNGVSASTAGTAGGWTEITWNGGTYWATGGSGGGFGGTGNSGGSAGSYGTRTTYNSGIAPTGGTAGGTGANSTNKYMGGGGGSGSNGSTGTTNAGTNTGGAGGSGVTSSADGLVYGAGGGGSGGTIGGAGGTNAGSGSGNSAAGGGGAATAGFGGGGGGTDGLAAGVGGAGGSGAVILSYDAYDIYVATANGTYGTSGGSWVNGSATNGIKKIFRGGFTTTINTTVAFGSTDIVVIESGHNLSISGTLTCGAIWINSGATLTINGGTVNCGPITANGTLNYVSGSINATYANTGYTVASTTYNNLTFSGTGSYMVGGNLQILGTLTLPSGAILNLNGNSISRVNAFSGTGTIRGSATSRIYVTGSSAGTIYMDQTTNQTTNRLKYFGLASNATATLGNTMVIYADTSYSGNLDLRSGSVLTSNTVGTNAALLQLRYNVSSDLHAVVGMNGGSLVGEALVEDYFVSGYRAYRQTGHTLDSAMSINQITDDFDLFGIMGSGASSGRGSSGNRDGLFVATSTAKNSVFTYKEDVSSGSKWLPFTASTSTNATIPVGQSIMFVMRPTGSGESGNYNGQLMDYEGKLNLRRNAVTVVKGSSGTVGYNLLSNPYSAYLNFDRFMDTNDVNLADKGFYKYDKAAKNYITHGKSNGQWVKNGSNFTVNNANIDPGDAIWVRVANAGTVYFHPSMTALTRSPDVSKGNKLELDSTNYTTLNVKMTSKSDSTLADYATIVASSWGGDMNYRAGDMSNMMGTCIDISVVATNNENLSIKTVSRDKNWLMPLNLQVCAEGEYAFQMSVEENKPGNGTEFELIDKFLNKSYKITTGQKVQFAVTADLNSKGLGRFYINSIAQNLSATSTGQLSVNTVYPNPVNSLESLSILNNQIGIEKVELLNSVGQVVFQVPQENLSDKIWSIDLSKLSLQKGVYFVKTTNKSNTLSTKIILN